jgi:nucleotide-binding universal stress UspA family protein
MIAIKRILVPTDFAEETAPAIGYALSLAKMHGAEVSVLHVLPSKSLKQDFAQSYVTGGLMEPGSLTDATHVPNMDDILERRRRIIHDFVREKIGAELLKSVNFKALVRFGKPVDEIIAAAKEERSDLIVTHRRSGLSLRGHISDRIVKQAPCPVLCIQSSAEVTTAENERVPLNVIEKWAA